MHTKMKREDGFLSAMYLVFLVTLGLMGMGAFMLIRSEGRTVASNAEMYRAQYAANGAAYYGIRRLELGILDEESGLDIGGAIVALDTTRSGQETSLFINSVYGDLSSRLRIRLKSNDMSGNAVYSTGTVFNVDARDSVNTRDPSLITQAADSIPTIDVGTLSALATAQGNVEGGTFQPNNGYPSGSFFQADGVTPTVTWVNGNLRVRGNRTVYGIFVVTGWVRLDGNARVQGIIYMPNNQLLTIHGGGNPSGSSVTGGVVSEGNLVGFGNHVNVRHEPTFMRTFSKYITGQLPGFKILAWEYL